ncbi:hypothetical protein M918_14020 [Clostridium sp. BL8]|nr:hypothetical protein M918_14020 [Clostridium sp. BL8]
MNYVGSTNMMKVHIIGDILLQGKGTNNVSAFGTALHVTDAKDALNKLEDGEIIVVKRLGREFMEILDKVAGIIVEEDEMSSSVVIECAAKDIPIIYNATGASTIIKSGCFITMDPKRGIVYSGRANISY